MTIDTEETRGSALATVLSEEGFHPIPPRSLEDTNLSAALIESLLLKLLAVVGSSSGRGIAERICLPFGVIESLLQTLRTRQFLTHTGSAPLNDYYYSLTEAGRDRAQVLSKAWPTWAPLPFRWRITSTRWATRPSGPRRPARAVGASVRRYFRRPEPVREPWSSGQFGGRAVFVRRDGQRQINPGGANDQLFRSTHLDSAGGRGGRAAHQALRRRLP